MTLDLADVLFVLNPGTGVSMVLVGIVFGVLFFRDRRQQRGYLFAAFLVGIVFFGTLAATRYVQASPTWEVWFGTAVLWGVYATGMAVGSVIGQRLWRRPLTPDPPAE